MPHVPVLPAAIPLALALVGYALLPVAGTAAEDAWIVPRAPGAIAFHRDNEPNEGDVYVMQPDGSGLHPLAATDVDEQQASWSPDSSQLLYTSGTGLIRIDADGTDPVKVAAPDGVASRGRWSPDGRQILFTGGVEGSPEDVFVIPAAGGPAVNLTNQPGRDVQADWSPDGSKIVFVSNRLGNLDVFEMNADGTGVHAVFTRGSVDRHPTYSPDGSRIAFDSTTGRTASDIYIIRPDGSGLTSLTADPSGEREPAWSPDGTRMAFSSSRAGSDDIYLMDVDGTDVIRLTDDARSERRPDWGPLRSVAIRDAAVLEGDGDQGEASFQVGLSVAHETDVTVSYATGPGTADGGEYAETSGVVVIPAGTLFATVNVPIVGDTLNELDETFTVQLSGATGAVISDGVALGTILDDDPPPTVSVADAAAPEGSGSLAFTVTLDAPSGRSVSVTYATANGTASAGRDYRRAVGKLGFPPGQTSTTISVRLLQDLVDEPDETFSVSLSGPSWASVVDGVATGTITDDDPAP